MKKIILFILVYALPAYFAIAQNTCETAVNYGEIDDAAQTGQISSGGEAWFSIIVTENKQNVIVSTCHNDTEFDTELQIWDACDGETPLAEGYDECNGYRSKIMIPEVPAGTYYIKVFGFDENEYGQYSLSIESYPPAEENTCETATDYGEINGAPQQGAINSYGAYWYKITTESYVQDAVFSLCDGSDFDTKMEIYRNCNSGYWLDNDDGCGDDSYSSEISVAVLTPGTYYIKVYGYDRYFGNYTLSITGTSTENLPLDAVRLTPEDEEENVSLDTPIEVIFNKNITPLDLTGITIVPDPGGVAASIVNHILYINHDLLEENTVYTVTIPGTAIEDYTSGLIWSFKTGVPSGLSEVDATNIGLYPNPAKTQVTLTNLPEGSVVTLLDLSGKAIKKYKSGGDLNIKTDMASGTYFIKIDKDGSSVTKKLIVE